MRWGSATWDLRPDAARGLDIRALGILFFFQLLFLSNPIPEIPLKKAILGILFFLQFLR
jgi:hypothetical protein